MKGTSSTPKVAHGLGHAQGLDRAILRRRLLRWYARVRRDLPWRHTRDAYAIWVSEIMLQQTRVQTVVPYYVRFLEMFPTVHALAEAPLDDVLTLWSGLGYYRRARLLHRGAEHVARELGGTLPNTAEELVGVPGIGRYTAGAIASIAFDRETPVVDGNVARVLSRIFLLEADPKSRDGERALWTIAGSLARGPRPGDLNQALMELGATVCSPRAPDCRVCPAAAMCLARAADRTEELPRVTKALPPKPVRYDAFVVAVGESVWLAKRHVDALFGGMWEPPLAATATPTSTSLAKMGGFESRGDLTHVLSHRRLEVCVYSATKLRAPHVDPFGDYEHFELVSRKALSKFALSTLARRILALAASVDSPKKAGYRAKS